jgi:hypothetical protein
MIEQYLTSLNKYSNAKLLTTLKGVALGVALPKRIYSI